MADSYRSLSYHSRLCANLLTPSRFSLSYPLMVLKGTILAAPLVFSLFLRPLAQEKEESKEVKNPLGKDKAASTAGREIYGSTCAACHGTTGQGGRGPRLADAVRGVRDMPDKKVFDVIKEGIKGT